MKIVQESDFSHRERQRSILLEQLSRKTDAIGALMKDAHQTLSRAAYIDKLTNILKETDQLEDQVEYLKENAYIDEINYETVKMKCSDFRKILTNSIEISNELAKVEKKK